MATYIVDKEIGGTIKMTTPDNLGDTLRNIVKTHHIPLLLLERDSKEIDPQGKGVSYSKLYQIVEYGLDPKEGGRVEEVLKMLIAELKQKYPCESKVR